MPQPDKDMLIQGMLSEIPLRMSDKAKPDSAEWWREVAEGLGGSYDLMRQRAVQAEQDRDAARAALRMFGQHQAECAVVYPTYCAKAGCTCGLDAALKAVR